MKWRKVKKNVLNVLSKIHIIPDTRKKIISRWKGFSTLTKLQIETKKTTTTRGVCVTPIDK